MSDKKKIDNEPDQIDIFFFIAFLIFTILFLLTVLSPVFFPPWLN